MPESSDITARDARTAAQMEGEVGAEHIAGVYARGLLGATEHAGQTAAVVEEFDALMAEVVGHFPKFRAVLDSVLVLPEEKETLIERVFGGRVSPTMVNFFKVVARHGRLDCLPAIHYQTHVLYDRLRNRIPVTLTTAAPASPEMIRRIIDDLLRQARRRAGAPAADRSRSDRRRGPPLRRHHLRRLDRQPVAEPPSDYPRQDRP